MDSEYVGAIMIRTIVEAEGFGYGIWNRELTESEMDELMALIPLGARRRITVMDDLKWTISNKGKL